MQIRFGEVLFDDDARIVSRNDEPLHLTPKAFELLRLLIEARPRAVPKEELRDRLWPEVVVEEANLKNLVAEIRAALGDDGRAIRTVHRYGYAFAGEGSAFEARLIDGERTYRLHRGVNRIGRDADCAVVIDFTGVSRHHATVRIADGTATLEDAGSKNGTWKNDERVREPVELRDGDRIRLGALVLTFRASAGEESTATV